MSRHFTLTDELRDYLVAHTMPLDEVARDLVEETRAQLPDRAGMQVAPEQAAFLTMLTQLVGARRGGHVHRAVLVVDRPRPGRRRAARMLRYISIEYTAVADRYWKRAQLTDRIELRIGPAAQRLRELPAEFHLDLAFIDADKEGYPAYWDELVPRMRPGGVVVVDNVLWSGRVLDPARTTPTPAPSSGSTTTRWPTAGWTW
jgi:caffeoyl-CoA O-methyltransferase